MHPDLTIAILSAIELPLPECVRAVESQLGGPYQIIHVENVCPMHRAFNEMIRLSTPSSFVVQVDGDVVLHTGAVETLYSFIRNRSWLYMAWGQLYEDGFGPGGAVRIWRRWPASLFKFRDKRCVDRDYHARVSLIGMRRKQGLRFDLDGFPEPFGIHYPRQTKFSRFSKARGDCMKWRLLVRYDLIQKLAESELDEPSLQGMISGLTAGEDEIRRSKDTMKDLSAYDPRRWVKA